MDIINEEVWKQLKFVPKVYNDNFTSRWKKILKNHFLIIVLLIIWDQNLLKVTFTVPIELLQHSFVNRFIHHYTWRISDPQENIFEAMIKYFLIFKYRRGSISIIKSTFFCCVFFVKTLRFCRFNFAPTNKSKEKRGFFPDQEKVLLLYNIQSLWRSYADILLSPL